MAALLFLVFGAMSCLDEKTKKEKKARKSAKKINKRVQKEMRQFDE